MNFFYMKFNSSQPNMTQKRPIKVDMEVIRIGLDI